MLIYIWFLCLCTLYSSGISYEPTWESLDARPLPSWYDEAKIGIFMHWGVYSAPGFGDGQGTSSEWLWFYWKNGLSWHNSFITNNYPPGFTYQEFAKNFKAEFYEPEKWANLLQKSGAKYVVLTSKHHDGFTLWPSSYSYSWNAMDVGPHRDILGDFAEAIWNKTDLKFGLYYSLFEWYNPLYMSDKFGEYVNNTFVTNKMYPELMELIKTYRPEILWSDGDWEASDTYFMSREFLAWLYNESPVKDTIVTNDRWGKGVQCQYGDFLTCADRYNPGVLQTHKWENAMSLDKFSWGFRKNANLQDYMTTHELLVTLAQTVSCGGNILINLGPTSEGTIAPIFEERLLDLGQWLSINGEAIYNSKPWLYQKDTLGNVWYTSKESVVYAIVLDWPSNNFVDLAQVVEVFKKKKVKVSLLGNAGRLNYMLLEDQIHIELPDKALVKSEWAWVIKFNYTRSLKKQKQVQLLQV